MYAHVLGAEADREQREGEKQSDNKASVCVREKTFRSACKLEGEKLLEMVICHFASLLLILAVFRETRLFYYIFFSFVFSSTTL